MDLDDEELKATRKLKGIEKDQNLEDVEILIETYFSNCKTKNEVFNTQVLLMKKLKEITLKRTNELSKEW